MTSTQFQYEQGNIAALMLSKLIRSGDLSSAQTYFEYWCKAQMVHWCRPQLTEIRNACSKWQVDASRFGC